MAKIDRREMPNSILIGEVVKLVDMGDRVTLRVKGNSMLPFIVGDRDSVILERANDYLVDDIVLAELKEGFYVIHRVIDIVGNEYTLMGDGNFRGTERCHKRDIRAKAISIWRNGKRIDCDNVNYRLWVKRWKALLPLRRYILAIYRRLII